MDNTTLDLDALKPESKTVKVNGKVYEIKPLKLTDFLNLQKTLRNIKGKSEEEMVDLIDNVFENIKPIVPEIEEMGLTIPQTMALLEFIYKSETPATVVEEKKTVVSPVV